MVVEPGTSAVVGKYSEPLTLSSSDNNCLKFLLSVPRVMPIIGLISPPKRTLVCYYSWNVDLSLKLFLLLTLFL